jgi:hypothetical protein
MLSGIEFDIGVSMNPGAMQFTVIPSAASESARLRLTPAIAPFDVA